MSTPDSLSDNPLREAFEARWSVISLDGGTVDAPVDATRPMKAEDFDHRIVLASLPGLTEADEGPDLVFIKTIGQGGMGRVELARQHSLNREVAVKQLIPDRRTPESLAALLREARITGSLEHPNIVPVHALGLEDKGSPMIVMKRIEGVCWRALIQDAAHQMWEHLPESRLEWHLKVLMEVCDALHFAHSRGIVHRDIKPDNVMIGHFDEVYLLDWGLGMRLDRYPKPKGIVGTPAFMAPEMLHGAGEVDCRTDVYLLGATLHCVLTGEPRHEGRNLQMVMMAAHTSKPFEYGPEVPEELARLCNEATSADPEDRPQSALAFKEAIEAFVAHRGSVALSDQASVRLGILKRLVGSESQGAGLEVSAAFAECRFGYQQALRAWPGNRAAREGLQGCLETMIERELLLGNKGFVEALLAEMPQYRPDLRARWEALEKAHADEALEQARLRRMEQDLDVGVGSRQRATGLLVMCLTIAGMVGLGAVLRRMDLLLLNHTTAIIMMVLLLVLLVLLHLRWRDLHKTTANRRLTGGIAVGALSSLAGRFLVALAELPIDLVFMLDVFILSIVLSLMGISVDRRLVWPALIGFVASFLSAAFLSYSMDIAALTFLACLLPVVWVWSRGPKGGEGAS